MQAFKNKFIYILLALTLFSACGDNTSSTTSDTDKTTAIDSLETISLGGVKQSILLQSKDISKPILLVLHGGPGFAMMPLLHQYNEILENHFIVVNWDQRGAGKSYSPSIHSRSMTLNQFMADAYELTQTLKTRFNREKIFLLAHSSGTILSTILAKNFPEDYYALANVGQVVDLIENEQLGYDFALDEAFKDNNTQAIKELQTINRPDEDGEYTDDSGYDTTIKWISYYGGELYTKSGSEEIEEFLLESDIYSNEQNKLIAGWSFSQTLFNDEDIWYLDFRESVNSIDVPIYFFTGRHDMDTPSSLVEEYYNILSTPTKEMIWFENSSHFPFYEEPEKFNDLLIDRFSKHTK